MHRKESYTALGLMTGTSMDGVDAAIIKTDGEKIIEIGEAVSIPFESRDSYKAVMAAALTSDENRGHAGQLVSRENARAVIELLEKAGLKPGDIDVVGFHGQTVLHKPESGVTIQLGDPKLLSELTGIKTIAYNFREADVKAGGQGAPLVPLYHLALAKRVSSFESRDPICFLNIGGISNITYIPSQKPDDMIAFDCGPGNAPLDDFVNKCTGEDYDYDGHISGSGIPDNSVIELLLEDPFFAKQAPKSLDRSYFGWERFDDMATPNGAATICQFIAEAVKASEKFLPSKPKQYVVCGGGRRNPTIMKYLDLMLGNVLPIESIGVDGDMVEAQAFGYLAVRTLVGLPISFPGTTGVSTPMRGGAIFNLSP